MSRRVRLLDILLAKTRRAKDYCKKPAKIRNALASPKAYCPFELKKKRETLPKFALTLENYQLLPKVAKVQPITLHLKIL